jgi:hypothetical protein
MAARRLRRGGITLAEIAAEHGVSVATVREDRDQCPAAFRVTGTRRTSGPGRPPLEFDRARVARLYVRISAVRAELAADAAQARNRGAFDPDDRVTARVAAARLGVRPSTVRSLPAAYRQSARPFPGRGPDGRWRWGDIADWRWPARPAESPKGDRAEMTDETRKTMPTED